MAKKLWWLPGLLVGVFFLGNADAMARAGLSVEAALWLGFFVGAVYMVYYFAVVERSA